MYRRMLFIASFDYIVVLSNELGYDSCFQALAFSRSDAVYFTILCLGFALGGKIYIIPLLPALDLLIFIKSILPNLSYLKPLSFVLETICQLSILRCLALAVKDKIRLD